MSGHDARQERRIGGEVKLDGETRELDGTTKGAKLPKEARERRMDSKRRPPLEGLYPKDRPREEVTSTKEDPEDTRGNRRT